MATSKEPVHNSYPKNGYYLTARKMVHSDLVRHPAAFVIFHCLLAWANFRDGNKPIKHNGKMVVLRPGQLPISPVDVGRRVGMSVNTVRKALRYLVANACIKLSVAYDGTLVTIPNYHVYQNMKSYEGRKAHQKLITPSREADQKLITPLIKNGSPSSLEARSKIDHTEDTLNTDLLLPSAFEPFFEYFKLVAPKKRVKEQESLKRLLGDFPAENVSLCFQWLRTNKIRGRNGEEEFCDHPFAYLEYKFDDVLRKAKPKSKPQVHDSKQQDLEESELTLAEMEEQLQKLQETAPEYAGAYQRLVEKKRAQYAV